MIMSNKRLVGSGTKFTRWLTLPMPFDPSSLGKPFPGLGDIRDGLMVPQLCGVL